MGCLQCTPEPSYNRKAVKLEWHDRADDAETQALFQTVQNKLHFAVIGKTALELIAERADAAKPNMGLTSWKGAVVRMGDVTIAKNYLREGGITDPLVHQFVEQRVAG